MTLATDSGSGLPDMKVSVRQVFGIDSDLEVPAYSEPDEYVPENDPDYRFDRPTTLAILAGFARNRRVIVTPSQRSTPEAIAKVEALWRATGANVERMAPAAHDAILAHASHLPQLVASALAASLESEHIDGKLATEYGAGGLRDTTRIAASSAEMWRDICLTNPAAILAALKLFRGSFDQFAQAVERGDGDELIALFERGRSMRERLK